MAPGAPGVTGTGGAAAFAANPIHHAGAPPARGAAGPGIVGQGGTGLGDEAAGSGVIGVSGDTPIPEGIGGYGGIFTSASHAQVHIVPAGNATQGANNPPPLPSNGQAGDLFVRVVVNADNLATAELWFCSRPVPGLPANTPPANTLVIWNQVTLGASTQPPGPLG